MSKKEDFKAALEGREPPGAVPVWELEFHAWDQASSRHVVLGEEFLALSAAEREKALHANAETLLSVSEEMHFAGLTVPGTYWEIAPGVPAHYWLPGDARYRQIEVIQEMGAGDLLLVAGSGGVMSMPGASTYLAFAYKLYDAPEEVDELARDALSRGLETARRLRDLGIEALFTASDIADNHGPWFNPEQMKRYILPYLSEWAAQVKRMGCYAILHTDGELTPCLEDIAHSGIHALQAIDPVAGMDILVVKRQVGGRLCLCGNLDCGLLVSGSPEEVYAAARDLLLGCKAGGGFVLGASNAVQPEVPIANYRAMIDAWAAHGRT